MSIYNFYHHYTQEIADPRVKDWPFMSGPVMLLVILSAYYYTVKTLLPNYMQYRKPYNLQRTIQIYNVFQVLACGVIILKLISYGWGTKIPVFGCCPVDYSNAPDAVGVATWIWATFILKLIELVETAFFTLRKKFNQVSTLHLYHHVTTAIIAWMGTKYVPGGMATFPVVLNSIIHMLMYSYYFLSTLGPEWQEKLNKWKSKLTILQMVQFCLYIVLACVALSEHCKVPRVMAYIFIPNIFVLLYLFYDFYQKAYKDIPYQYHEYQIK